MGEKVVKVLIVDDDPEFSSIQQSMLVANHYICRRVNDVRDALEEAKRFRPDLVLLDVHFSGYDAADFIQCYEQQCLEEDQPEARIIVMSAHAEDDVVEFFLKNGAVAYLQKPYNKEDLLDVLRHCMEHRASSSNTLTQDLEFGAFS